MGLHCFRLATRIAAALGAALLLAPGIAPAQEGPLEINAVLPITGGGAFLGKAELQSVQAFEAYTNRTGGIRGRPIKFVITDDETNPQVALQLFNQIIAKHASIIIGPGFTASCSAVLPLVTNGPFTYCLSPGIHPPPGSYMFAADVGTIDIWGAEVQYARERGWTRVATILTNDASGQDISRQIDTLLAQPENRNLQIVSRQTFQPSDLNAGAQMANIKNANPQVLLTGAAGSAFGTLMRSARDVGLEVPVFASSSNMSPEEMNQFAAFLPRDLLFANARGVVVEPAAPRAVRQAQLAFFEAFKPTGIHPSEGHTVPWDALAIVVDALRHVGSNATPAQLRDYVAGLEHWTGAAGDYDFHKVPARGIGLDATVIYRWSVAKGDYVIVSKPGGRL